jgi:hypothetical protein
VQADELSALCDPCQSLTGHSRTATVVSRPRRQTVISEAGKRLHIEWRFLESSHNRSVIDLPFLRSALANRIAARNRQPGTEMADERVCGRVSLRHNPST